MGAAQGSAQYPMGTIIADRYEIVSFLAEGGMAQVYVAIQRQINRQVAIKVLSSMFSMNPNVVKRFFREAQVVGQLSHPNTVRIYDMGETPDHRLFIAMELLKGEELGDRIRRGLVPPEEALQIVKQVAGSLSEAHQLGIIHRDLKPDNIFLTNLNVVKVLDFGIAKLKDDSEDGNEKRLTKAGTAPGTPEYMSPEQARGQELDARSDLYSLGIVLYEMLCGHPPFEEATFLNTILRQVQDPPPPLPEFVPGILRKYVIERLLAKDPKLRPDNAEVFIQEVDELLRRLSVGSQASASSVGNNDQLDKARAEIAALRDQLAMTKLELLRSEEANLEASQRNGYYDETVVTSSPVYGRPEGYAEVNTWHGESEEDPDSVDTMQLHMQEINAYAQDDSETQEISQPPQLMDNAVGNSDTRVQDQAQGIQSSVGVRPDGYGMVIPGQAGMVSESVLPKVPRQMPVMPGIGGVGQGVDMRPGGVIPSGGQPRVQVGEDEIIPPKPRHQLDDSGIRQGMVRPSRASMPVMPVMPDQLGAGAVNPGVPRPSRAAMPVMPEQLGGVVNSGVPRPSRAAMPVMPEQLGAGVVNTVVPRSPRGSMPVMPEQGKSSIGGGARPSMSGQVPNQNRDPGSSQGPFYGTPNQPQSQSGYGNRDSGSSQGPFYGTPNQPQSQSGYGNRDSGSSQGPFYGVQPQPQPQPQAGYGMRDSGSSQGPFYGTQSQPQSQSGYGKRDAGSSQRPLTPSQPQESGMYDSRNRRVSEPAEDVSDMVQNVRRHARGKSAYDYELDAGNRPFDAMTGRVASKSGVSMNGTPQTIFMMYAQPLCSKLGPQKVEDALYMAQGIWNASVLGRDAVRDLYESAKDTPNLVKLIEAMLVRKEKYFVSEEWQIENLCVKIGKDGSLSIDFDKV